VTSYEGRPQLSSATWSGDALGKNQ